MVFSGKKPPAEKTPKPPKPKKAKASPPSAKPVFQLTPQQAMQLEVYFMATPAMPTHPQMIFWAKELGMMFKDIKAWFLAKWRARLEAEAAHKTLTLATAYNGHSISTALNFGGLQPVPPAGLMGGADKHHGIPLLLNSRRPIPPDVFGSSAGLM